MARLTFAIPYFSKPDFLIETLKSVFEQTCDDWICVIYDDNPLDPLDISLIENFLHDSRVSYYLNDSNLGIAENWNRCIKRCRTEFVTILHSDDVLLPNYLDLALTVLDRHKEASAFFCQTHIIDEYGKRAFSFVDWVKSFLRPNNSEFRVYGEDGANSLLRGNYIMCPTVCYRYKRIEGKTFRAKWKMVLDLDFYITILLDGGMFVGTSIVAYQYRRHSLNQTSILSHNLDRFREEISYYKSTSEVLLNNGWEKAARTASKFRIVKLHLLFLAIKDIAKLEFNRSIHKVKLLGLA